MREKVIRSLITQLETQGLVKAYLRTRECTISLDRGKITIDCWLSGDSEEQAGDGRDIHVPGDARVAEKAPIKSSTPEGTEEETILFNGEAKISGIDPGGDRGEPIAGMIDEKQADLAPRDTADGSLMTPSAIRQDMEKFAAENPHLAKRYALEDIPRPQAESASHGKVWELLGKVWELLGKFRRHDPGELPPLLRGEPCEVHAGSMKTWMCTECGKRFCSKCVTPHLGHYNVLQGEYDVKSASCPGCGQRCIDLEFEWKKRQREEDSRIPRGTIVRWLTLAVLTMLFLAWTWQGTYFALLSALLVLGPLRYQPKFPRYLTLAVMFWVSVLSLFTGPIWPPVTITEVMNRGAITVFLVVPAAVFTSALLGERIVHAVANWIAR